MAVENARRTRRLNEKKKSYFNLNSIKSVIKKRPTLEQCQRESKCVCLCICVCHGNIIIFETDFNSLLREVMLFSLFHMLLCFTVISHSFHPSWLRSFRLFSFPLFFFSSLFIVFLLALTLCEFIVGTLLAVG